MRALKLTFAIPELGITTLYTNPLVNKLTEAILRLSSVHKVTVSSSNESRKQVIDETVTKFKGIIDQMHGKSSAKHKGTNGVGHRGKVVALTGSTGALGSYILHKILSQNAVSHVYCLNRENSSARQVKVTKRMGFRLLYPAIVLPFFLWTFHSLLSDMNPRYSVP
ncbi:hypothetical protein ACMFMG_003197 [Clarireedia jacksonii]